MAGEGQYISTASPQQSCCTLVLCYRGQRLRGSTSASPGVKPTRWIRLVAPTEFQMVLGVAVVRSMIPSVSTRRHAMLCVEMFLALFLAVGPHSVRRCLRRSEPGRIGTECEVFTLLSLGVVLETGRVRSKRNGCGSCGFGTLVLPT